MTSKTDELGRATQFQYDALGRLTRVTDAKGGITQYGYDEVGNRVSQTDANGHVTSFEYDGRGRETRRTLPGGAYEWKWYNGAGRVTTRVDFLGRATTYSYDSMNRLTQRTYPDTSTVGFTYTPTGRRASVTDARGTTSYDYDSRDRVTRLTYPDGRALEYGYNGVGARTSLTARVAGRVLATTYTYDAAERPDLVTDPALRVYDVDFDGAGRRTSLAYPNGTATIYSHDARNRLTSIQALGVQGHTFTLDNAGNRTRIDEADGTARVYGYDELGRLTTENVSGGLGPQYGKTFTYDAVGNRLTQVTTGDGAGTQSYTYDDRDRLLTENGTTYGWDANGNLTSKSGEATYTWDFENRLIRVDLADGTAVEHLYDADGNRVKTTVTPSGGTGSITHFLVDTCGGGSCNTGLSHVVAETDGINALTALYVRLADELIAVTRPDGLGGYVARWVHHDGIGSVRALTDDAAAVTDTRSYEAFGVENRRIGTDPIAYGFAGEAFQGESRLAYHRARWMDARVGRFLGVDPFRTCWQRTVQHNPYAYGGANPTTLTDPTGGYTLEDLQVANLVVGVLALIAVQPGARNFCPDVATHEELGEHGGGASSADDFVQIHQGQKLSEVIHETEFIAPFPPDSNAEGPWPRYVKDPANSSNIIDMRHFLVVGYYGGTYGLAVEMAQYWHQKGWEPEGTAFNAQDLFSNRLGSEFFSYYPVGMSTILSPHLKKYFDWRQRMGRKCGSGSARET
jgi:RHS repeat-associated protein